MINSLFPPCSIYTHAALAANQMRWIKQAKKPVNLDDLLDDICTIFFMKKKDVISPGREQQVVVIRRLFCYIARKKTGGSLRLIGLAIGGRDHTTVLHNYQVAEGLIETHEPYFCSYYESYCSRSNLYKSMT